MKTLLLGALFSLCLAASPARAQYVDRTKITDGTNTATVTASGAVKTDASATTQPVTAASLPLPTGAATETSTAATASAAGAPADAAWSGAGSGTIVAILKKLYATLSGTLTTNATIQNASLAVTGPLTDAQLRAAPVPVSGTFWQATQPVSGPLTDAQLRASPPAFDISRYGGSAVGAANALHVQPGTGAVFPVSASSLPLPTGASTLAEQQAQTTALQLIDDAAHADDAARGKSLLAGAVLDDVSTTAVTENNGGFLRMSDRRALLVEGVSGGTALKVDGSAVTQPVSGTVTANAGTGTMAVSAASLPLPSGAATAAKQPALGTAGSPSTDVITVQGVASMTALKVDGSAVTQPVSGTFWQATQPVSGTFWQATQPVSGTVTANQGTANATPWNSNLAQIGGAAVQTGNGTAAGNQRVTLASDSTGNVATIGTSVTPGTAAAHLGKAEDAAAATGDTGLAMLGIRKDDATQTTSAAGDYAAPSLDAYGAGFARSDHPNRIRCATAAVSTATTITALGGSCVAPGAGLSIYITDISFSTSAAAGTAADSFPTLKYGTGGTCGTGTTVVWGALTTANSTVVNNLTTPIKIPANSEVCWMMSTAGSKFIVLTGYIAP